MHEDGVIRLLLMTYYRSCSANRGKGFKAPVASSSAAGVTSHAALGLSPTENLHTF